MQTLDGTIKKGSIVQERTGTGSSGIVVNVLPDFWKHADDEFKKRWLSTHIPLVSESKLEEECWFEVAMFYDFWDFLGGGYKIHTYQSNLTAIEIEQVSGLCAKDAIVGRIDQVEVKDQAAVLYLKPLAAGREVNRPELTICNPSVIPYAGDVVCGTREYLVIRSEGLNYPYRHQDGSLTQDW